MDLWRTRLPPAAFNETIEHYRFDPADLRISERRRGISAFMRVRNGAYSLEAAIRSHMPFFDEIVAVHNRCTDETPAILARLAAEFGPKLRVYHYLPPVFPQGSDGHKREVADSAVSLVNYYNLALTLTRFSHATKLDDDHVAMGEAMARLTTDVRAGTAANTDMACFSGLNLARDEEGNLGILAREPFAGNGDHWIFPVQPGTYFVHDPRFEVLRQGGLKRRFHSFAYWHLKSLKPDFGFSNYDLEENPDSRYARRLGPLVNERAVIDLQELARRAGRPSKLARLEALGVPVPERDRVLSARARAAVQLGRFKLEELLDRDPLLAPFLQPQPR